MRQIEIYYDVDNDVLRDEDGNQINSQLYPFVYFEEQALAQVQLRNGDCTDYTKLTGTYSISATIDNDFDAEDDALCKTLNANINVSGDWKSGGDADITLGQISIQIDADNTNYETKIGSKKTLNAFLEIQLRDSGDDSLTNVFEFNYECRNLRDQTGTVPPSPENDYYKKTEVDSLVDGRVAIAGDTMTGDLLLNGAKLGVDNLTPGSYFNGGNNIVAGSGSLNAGVTIASGTANTGYLLFADGTTTSQAYEGIVEYNHANNYMALWANHVEALRIESNGTLVVKTANYETLVTADDDIPNWKKVKGTDVAWTTATKTLALSEDGSEINANSASAMDLTIPTNASVAFDVGAKIVIYMIGAGVVTITGDTGVTVKGVSAGTGDMAQYEAVCLKKIDTNEWLAIGNITIA
jgi:hypothetical protein